MGEIINEGDQMSVFSPPKARKNSLIEIWLKYDVIQKSETIFSASIKKFGDLEQRSFQWWLEEEKKLHF